MIEEVKNVVDAFVRCVSMFEGAGVVIGAPRKTQAEKSDEDRVWRYFCSFGDTSDEV